MFFLNCIIFLNSSLILFLLLSFTPTSSSQDIIALKNGAQIKARNIKILEKEIAFKNYDDATGKEIKLGKDKITSIKYQNGTLVNYDSGKTESNSTPAANKPWENLSSPVTDNGSSDSDFMNMMKKKIRQDSVFLEYLKMQLQFEEVKASEMNENLTNLMKTLSRNEKSQVTAIEGRHEND